jgi:hypothetical protein
VNKSRDRSKLVRAAPFAGGVIAALAWLSIAAGPSAVSPYPVIVALPAFVIGPVAVLVPATLFWTWTVPLFRSEAEIPRPSAVALGLLTALTPVWFVLCWEDGVQYQGRVHTVGMAVLNAVILVGAWYLLLRGRTTASISASLCFHVVLFGWLAWSAFPYLGELP